MSFAARYNYELPLIANLAEAVQLENEPIDKFLSRMAAMATISKEEEIDYNLLGLIRPHIPNWEFILAGKRSFAGNREFTPTRDEAIPFDGYGNGRRLVVPRGKLLTVVAELPPLGDDLAVIFELEAMIQAPERETRKS